MPEPSDTNDQHLSKRVDLEAKRAREAERILKGVDRDSETFGTSTMARTADQIVDHMKARDKSHEDDMEVLGTRIGRVLSVIAFVGLAIYLVMTYFLD